MKDKENDVFRHDD